MVLIAYGKGDKAISEDLHVSAETAQEIRNAVLGAFPQLAEYLKNVVVFGKEHGYVKDFYGRKRRLPMLTKIMNLNSHKTLISRP